MLNYPMPPEGLNDYNDMAELFPGDGNRINLNDFIYENVRLENELADHEAVQLLNNPDLLDGIGNIENIELNDEELPDGIPNENSDGDTFWQDNDISPEASEFFGKMKEINDMLSLNLIGCDANWSLFVCAAMSFRYKTALALYPEWLTKDNELDITTLTRILSDTPPLLTYFEVMERDDCFDDDSSILDLLHWLLCSQNTYLRRLDSGEKSKLLRNLHYPNGLAKPDHIFELKSNASMSSEEHLFNFQSAHYPIYWTYYGDTTDTFFGLVHKGFDRLAKDKDRQLVLNLNVEDAVKKSKISPAWGGSMLSPCISCVAVTECIDNPLAISYLEQEKAVHVMDASGTRIRYLYMYCEQLQPEQEPEKPTTLRICLRKLQHFKWFGCVLIMGSVYFMRNRLRYEGVSGQLKYFLSTIVQRGGKFLNFVH